MALLEFQTALGRIVQTVEGQNQPASLADICLLPSEATQIDRLIASPGLQFTRSVQRSWCEGRAADAAPLTLSALPITERRRLVNAWIDAGGGTALFFARETEAFLDFVATQLPDASQALTICNFERAVHRARLGIPLPTEALDPSTVICRGRYASLVVFFAHVLLFAPGIPGLFRPATKSDEQLWTALAEPVSLHAMLAQGHERSQIDELFAVGAISHSV